MKGDGEVRMTQEIHQFQADECSRLTVEGLLIVFAAKLVNGLIGLGLMAVLDVGTVSVVVRGHLSGGGTASFAGIGGVVIRLILFVGMI